MKSNNSLKPIFIRVGIVLTLLLIVLSGSIAYTSRPSFCQTCHYMVPFYEGWKQSAHSDVDCTVCHFEPGIAGTMRGKIEGLLQVAKYVTNAYKRTKPWAEISDLSCLRSGCHDTRLLDGDVEFKEGIMFDHTPHLTELRRGKKLRCTSCHSQIVQGDHITVTGTTCFLCHFKNEPLGQELAECTLCHKQENFMKIQDKIRYDHTTVFEKGYDCRQCHTNMVVGDGAVHLETCFDCHFEPERLDKVDDGDFLHQTHITEHKIECVQCHLTLQHKIVKSSELDVDDCTTCHINMHGAQRVLFSGTVNGHEPIPNPMQEVGLNCRGCHIFHEETTSVGEETFRAKGESCESCHGEGYSRLFENWESFAESRLEKVMIDYKNIEKIVGQASMSNLNRRQIREKMDTSFGYMELVRAGKAVHNIRLSEEILNVATKNLIDVANLTGSKYKVTDFELSSDLVPTDCIACHTDIVEKEVSVYGVRYSHEKHLSVAHIECKTCHSNINKHGELKLKKEQCLNCHHKQESRDCSYCHDVQSGLYSGSLLELPEVEPDLMFDADVSCEDCHRNDEEKVVLPTESECAECHDEGYGEMLVEWRENYSSAIEVLGGLMAELDSSDLDGSEIETLTRVKDLINWLESDGSRGAHNYFYVENLLDNLVSELEDMRMVKKQ